MRLRFATEVLKCPDPDAVLAAADHTCRWTGFRSRLGMHAYLEEDGAEAVACSVSFAARHAGMLDPARHVLVWVPELTQEAVARIARLHALATRTYHSPGENAAAPSLLVGHEEVAAVRDEIGAAYAELKVRSETVHSLLGDSGISMAALLERMPPEARERIIDGLRVLPVGFGAKEIESWTEPGGSMEGVSIERAFGSRWFCEEGSGLPQRDWSVAPKSNGGAGNDRDMDVSAVSTQGRPSRRLPRKISVVDLRGEGSRGTQPESSEATDDAARLTTTVEAIRLPPVLVLSRKWLIDLCGEAATLSGTAADARRMLETLTCAAGDHGLSLTPEVAALVTEVQSGILVAGTSAIDGGDAR